jgi:hypothetical protein
VDQWTIFLSIGMRYLRARVCAHARVREKYPLEFDPLIHLHTRARRRIDGCSREGRFLAAARAELAAHVGGKPSRAETMSQPSL